MPWLKIRFFEIVKVGLAFILLGFFATAQANAQVKSVGTMSELETIPSSAQIVDVGLYLNSVYQLEVANSTYYLDAYLWFKWKGDIDPTQTMEVTNLVEEWSMMITPLNEEPMLLSDGSKYKLMKVEGRFMQPFILADYPLDFQKLSVFIEDNTYGIKDIVYRMDTEGSGYGHMLKIPGWKIENWSSKVLQHDYGSFFGAQSDGAAAVYSTLRFDLEISRPVNFFTFKLLLPLLIILSASWIVLLLHPRLVDARTALPGMGLLTAVFLQQAYSDGLPEVGYLVLIDKIYAVAYALIVVTLFRGIWTARDDFKNDADIAAAKKTDKQLLVAQVGLFTCAVIFIVMTR